VKRLNDSASRGTEDTARKQDRAGSVDFEEQAGTESESIFTVEDCSAHWFTN
jgi:hypothetical protein